VSLTVCLSANTLDYPNGGGHLWMHLNWALGLRAVGCQVIWLEGMNPGTPVPEVRASVAALKSRLQPYGLAEQVALCTWTGEPVPPGAAVDCLSFDAATDAHLLVDLRYDIASHVLARFRRTVLIDIDPGILQYWLGQGQIPLAPHDLYFTIGETVGRPGAPFPDCGLRWHYTPPPVFLPEWPMTPSEPTAPYSTVSSWWGEWMECEGELFSNEKRTAFLDYVTLPTRTPVPLELALCIEEQPEVERPLLEGHGWRVQRAWDVTATPEQYRAYIQRSRGEFSCAKPACLRFQNAWISDRTLCYLASGKPAVVQHTGPSRFLPDAAGLFRFRTMDEAVQCLKTVEADYERHCRLARALAEEYFDARRIVGRLLERAFA